MGQQVKAEEGKVREGKRRREGEEITTKLKALPEHMQLPS